MCNDAFINTNAATVHLLATARTLSGSAAQQLEQAADMFERGIEYDAVDDSAFPVYVYTVKGKPVAWYDLELAEGYVANVVGVAV